MDSRAFAASLDTLYVGPPREGVPADDRMRRIVDSVAGYTPAAELTILHKAVSQLPEGEAYLEVGTFKGRSICAALIDGTDKRVVAIENFQEFGMSGAQARQELMSNLEKNTAESPRFSLVEGDCFAVLQDPSVVGEPVGVYFYDGAHTWLAHYLALGVAEHLLADEAVVVVDDASWPVVRRATSAYITRHPGWSVMRAFDAEQDHDPRWANGVLILRYNRPPGAPREIPRDVRGLLVVQRYIVGPTFDIAWKVVPRSRLLVMLGKKFFGRGSHTVGG